jgi:hypothetical protein
VGFDEDRDGIPFLFMKGVSIAWHEFVERHLISIQLEAIDPRIMRAAGVKQSFVLPPPKIQLACLADVVIDFISTFFCECKPVYT